MCVGSFHLTDANPNTGVGLVAGDCGWSIIVPDGDDRLFLSADESHLFPARESEPCWKSEEREEAVKRKAVWQGADVVYVYEYHNESGGILGRSCFSDKPSDKWLAEINHAMSDND